LIHHAQPTHEEAAAPEDLAFPQKKKGQPLSQDGWLFFFVPMVAETLSVLKEAG
jgi:hypothetical protein